MMVDFTFDRQSQAISIEFLDIDRFYCYIYVAYLLIVYIIVFL